MTTKQAFFSAAAVFLFLVFCAPVFAGGLDLSAAKQAGLIGEGPDGFVAPVSSAPSAELQKLVEDTNAGRRIVYQKTAGDQNIPLSSVQKIAAEKLRALAPAGDYFLVEGKWRQK